ncbi:MAG TPA: NAD-dependent epimerase/dehydratase family protein [Gaiellaceae bacterium]
MKVYVTGASGFVGAHVGRALEQAGHEIRTERADLLDPAALERAIDGCEAVVHVAALYSYDADDAAVEAVNVTGTGNVLAACRRRGVRRLVHTSTAGTCGPVRGREATEDDGPPGWELEVPYKRTKLAAERLVMAAARDGLDAVVVNPTTPVGPGDRKPTPTGRMVAGVARGRVRAFVGTTGLNVVDVADVARGHVLALERGRRGERYLLGGLNLTLRDLFAAIADAAGRPRPRLRVPYGFAAAAAMLGLANRHEVRLARLPMFFSHEKARRELGYRPGPVDEALVAAAREALARESGRCLVYAPSRRDRRSAAPPRAAPAMPSRK